MKKRGLRIISACLLAAALLACAFSSRAETLGFGVVNDTNVALRKAPGGQKLVRLPKDTCVWIKGAERDGSGSLWYEVVLGYDDEGTYRRRSGWMKAEFIDAGDTLWHGVDSVKAGPYGMMALRKDGTVECVCDMGSRELRAWAAGLRDIRQVSLTWLGWGFYALSGDGTFTDADGHTEKEIRLSSEYGYPFLITEDGRLLTGGVTAFTWVRPADAGAVDFSRVTAMTNSGYRLLLLMDDGRVRAASLTDEAFMPEPGWENWTDVAQIDAGVCALAEGGPYRYAFAAVRKDGAVLAAPEELSDLIGSWQDMKKVCVGSRWILGLRNDGTAVALAPGGGKAPDVSGWSGVTDIGNGGDYLVGVKEDGTLVFAGEHAFSD